MTQRCALLLVGLGLVACKNDQGIAEIGFEKVAIATGDFDEIEDALTRAGVEQELYEGYISQSVYSPDTDPASMTLKMESLFRDTDEDGNPLLFTYDAVFVNSGARGLGAYVYNSVDKDDDLVTDPAVVTTVQDYVGRVRTVVVSDWGYDLVEAAWPDKITFLNEADGLDAAQVGVNEANPTVIADVVNPKLVDALGGDQLEVAFDFSHWTVMEDVGDGVDVHLRGDVEYQGANGTGTLRLEDVPLLVSFPMDGGLVIFSSFSWRAQRAAVIDILLGQLIEGYDPKESDNAG